MKKILLLLSLLVFAAFPAFAQEPEAEEESVYVSPFPGLDSLLTQFYDVLERVSTEEKNSELDHLIVMVSDSLARQHVTMTILDHYMFSRVMGEESVAVHVYDTWIASGLVKPRGEFESMQAEIFARFNRHSLLGMKATPVELYKSNGRTATVPEEGRISIMFFYDTNCAKCRLESKVLPLTLAKIDFPADFNAVYVGSDKRSWKEFRKTFKVKNSKVRVRHFWDPDIDSDYAVMYAVTGTPRLYVIWSDLEIIGRRLEVTNLEEIIQYISLTYGKKED